jgi:DUF4097 and DUF4098 domain-containing protein YvlB
MYRAQAQMARMRMRGMRRSSILGPLLLIGFGVVALLVQTHRLPPPMVWDWYLRWWPLLLVAAGVVLLAEWSWDQYRMRDGETLPYRRSFGTGVIALVFLLVLTGVVGTQIHRYGAGPGLLDQLQWGPDNLDQLFGDKHESDQTLELPMSPGAALTVTVPHGDVSVSGTSDDGKVHLALHKQVYAHSDSDAETKARELSPVTNDFGSGLTIAVPKVDGTQADLVVTVPAGTAVTITSDHGDIHVASIKAAVSATANHGDIELTAISGPATAHINNGRSSLAARSLGSGLSVEGHAQDVSLTDVTGPVSLHGEFFGTTHLEHIAGTLHFHTSRTDLQLARLDGSVEISPRMNIDVNQVVGPFVLTTSNRNINLDRVSGDISVTNKNGTIDVTAAPVLGQLTLTSRNGSVKAVLPEHAGFTVQATTSNGDITSDFGLASQGSESHRSMSGTVGAGGPVVRIATTNGDVTLSKGDIAPLPAVAPVAPKLSVVPPAAPVVSGGHTKRKPAAEPGEAAGK